MPTKVNSVEPRSRRTRSQKKHTQGIICYFNHQCYLTFITGCYSCKWKVKREKKSSHKICCCSWVQRVGKELDHTFSDRGNLGWSLTPWGFIRVSRTGCARAYFLHEKTVSILEPKLTLLKHVLVFFIFFHLYSFYVIHLFIHFCFYSFSKPWRKNEV